MSNKEEYAKQVKLFKVDYWRSDERRVVKQFFPNVKARMLVVGCGAGRTLPHLARIGYSIVAIDNVPEMVNAAQQKTKDLHNVQVKEMDATMLTIGEQKFDYVFFPFHGLSCVHPNIFVAVEEFARVLKPNGVLVCNMHNRSYLKKLKYIFRGEYANYDGLCLYRATFWDAMRFRKFFFNVRMRPRICLQDTTSFNWKDWCYRILPFFDKSLYFICQGPKHNTTST